MTALNKLPIQEDWQQDENRMLQTLKTHPQLSDLTTTTHRDKYCPWDAENNQCIVEMKYRGYHKYPDLLIEAMKLDRMQEQDLDNRVHLYACEANGKIYIFNLTKLREEGYDFNWQQRMCNAHTKFHSMGAHKILKDVGFLMKSDATYVMEMK